MNLRECIEHLLALSDEELKESHAVELEDAVQRGLAAVHSGELWICHVQRELDAARGVDPDRAAALELEIERSRASVAEVRSNVGPLHQRAQDLGVGAPV
jgi:hypothetical protein